MLARSREYRNQRQLTVETSLFYGKPRKLTSARRHPRRPASSRCSVLLNFPPRHPPESDSASYNFKSNFLSRKDAWRTHAQELVHRICICFGYGSGCSTDGDHRHDLIRNTNRHGSRRHDHNQRQSQRYSGDTHCHARIAQRDRIADHNHHTVPKHNNDNAISNHNDNAVSEHDNHTFSQRRHGH